MKIIAWAVALFWFVSMAFVVLNYIGSITFGMEFISGEAGRFVMMMFTISVFGLALIEART